MIPGARIWRTRGGHRNLKNCPKNTNRCVGLLSQSPDLTETWVYWLDLGLRYHWALCDSHLLEPRDVAEVQAPSPVKDHRVLLGRGAEKDIRHLMADQHIAQWKNNLDHLQRVMKDLQGLRRTQNPRRSQRIERKHGYKDGHSLHHLLWRKTSGSDPVVSQVSLKDLGRLRNQ